MYVFITKEDYNPSVVWSPFSGARLADLWSGLQQLVSAAVPAWSASNKTGGRWFRLSSNMLVPVESVPPESLAGIREIHGIDTFDENDRIGGNFKAMAKKRSAKKKGRGRPPGVPTKSATFRLPEDLLEELDLAAADEDRTKTMVLRRALEAYLREREEE